MIPRQRRTRRQSLFHATTAIAVVLLLLFVFLGAGYIYLLPADEPGTERQAALENLARNEALWQRERPGRLSYTVVRQCYCQRAWIEPYVVREDDGGRRASFRDPLVGADGSTTTPPEPLYIDELFGMIREALEHGRRVDVEYDRRYGYPARVHFRSEYADGAWDVAVRDFRTTTESGP